MVLKYLVTDTHYSLSMKSKQTEVLLLYHNPYMLETLKSNNKLKLKKNLKQLDVTLFVAVKLININ